MEDIKKEEQKEQIKEYYTKEEVDGLINKKLLEFSTDLIARIDLNKKEEPKVEEPKSYKF